MLNSNWKFAIENYCESYHLPTIHPELNKVSNINDHYHIHGLPNRFAGQGSEKYEQPIKGNKKFDTFKNWEKSMTEKFRIYCIISKCNDWFTSRSFLCFLVEPVAVNKTKEHMQMYYVGDKSANGRRS